MNNNFVNALKKEVNFGNTENGAICLKSTGNDLVNLFGTIGALRKRNEEDIEKSFSKAFGEDKLLATKMSFYARDIRGGLGERRTSHVIWKYLANNYPDIMRKNIEYIPEFGRWDDLYIFIGTPIEDDMWKLITRQFKEDLENMNMGKPISLLAKWLKSINTSSKKSVEIGNKTAKKLGLSSSEYRRSLSKMRRYIDVTEVKMSNKKWEDIVYSNVPSKAMNIYRNAFKKNDEERFLKYLNDVSNGRDKINSSVLYPYDIVEKYMYTYNVDTVLEEQWKSLPNFINTEDNIIVMADMSGSMNGRPMATSIGLAIYFAERNHGAFHNLFMTFSKEPELVELKGNSLKEKIKNSKSANWSMNTNIKSAFDMLLNVAIKNNLSSNDMPKSIIIITDMEFDHSGNNDWCFYDTIKNKFLSYGYTIPNIVFWNVDARNNTFHASSDYKGVQIASGQSTAVFKSILECINLTPYEAMIKILNNDTYNCITV